MREIDARGQQCPKPLIMTRSALSDKTIEYGFTVLTDNATSKDNIERYLSDNSIKFTTTEKNDCWHIQIEKPGTESVLSEPELHCPVTTGKNRSDHIICIKSRFMGNGSDELGELLMKGFVNTIKEISPLPGEIILYNSGVLLATDDSTLAETFAELHSLGIRITVCGTCADYFSVKDHITTGTISNMYDILSALSNCSRVIYP